MATNTTTNANTSANTTPPPTNTSTSATTTTTIAPNPALRLNRAPLLLAALVLLARVGGVPAAAPAANGEDRGVSLFVQHAPCVRLFHSGGDVGCRSERKEGVTGPLLLVDSEGVLRDIEVCVCVCVFFFFFFTLALFGGNKIATEAMITLWYCRPVQRAARASSSTDLWDHVLRSYDSLRRKTWTPNLYASSPKTLRLYKMKNINIATTQDVKNRRF